MIFHPRPRLVKLDVKMAVVNDTECFVEEPLLQTVKGNRVVFQVELVDEQLGGCLQSVEITRSQVTDITKPHSVTMFCFRLPDLETRLEYF